MAPKTTLTHALTIALIAPLAALAQTPQLEPGEYISQAGRGHLKIKRGKDGTLAFAIESVGGNAHTCSLDGPIRSGKATLESEVKGKPCLVTFTAKTDGVEVGVNDSGLCRHYCGARASFEQMYFRPAAGCDRGNVRKSRSAFRQQYDRKDFFTARATLEPVLKGCEKTLDWLEEGWIRNDVALAQLRTGDPAECRRTLEPLAAEAAHSDDKIREMFPPADATHYLPIVKATRANLRLCASAAKAAR